MLMLVPLMILAALSIGGGFIKAPKFLEPVFQTSVAPTGGETSLALEHASASAKAEESAHSGTETTLMVVSVLVALLGFFFAWLLYHKRPHLPVQIADSLGGFYRTVHNKYYVDQLYSFFLIAPLVAMSRKWLWKGVDQGLIDTVINDSAQGTSDLGGALKHMQSGNLRSYAAWLTLGAAVVVAYMVWLGVH